MRGVSRDSLAAGRERLEALLAARPSEAATVGDELFAVTGLLAANAGLRRALSDPARSAEDRANLVHRLLGGRIGATTEEILIALVRHRWAGPGDLTDAVEELAVETYLASAERAGRLDAVEDELFRFARAIAADVGLRDAFAVRTLGGPRKRELVRSLLAGKVTPESLRLAEQAAVAPRGLRTEQVLERFVEAAALRRKQLVASVVSAVALNSQQRERLGTALHRIYGRPIRLNAEVVPDLVGGIRVQVGGELLDGSVLGRLETTRRRLGA